MKKVCFLFFLSLVFFSACTPEYQSGIVERKMSPIGLAKNSMVAVAAEDKYFGSGFIHDLDAGVIVTASHVFGDGELFPNNIIFGGRYIEILAVGMDVVNDVAVVLVDPKEIVGGSELGIVGERPEAGDLVMCLGYPDVFRDIPELFVGWGRVSGHIVDAEGIDSMLISTNVVPGMSGGPIVDMDGNVVGLGNWYYPYKRHFFVGISASPSTELVKSSVERLRSRLEDEMKHNYGLEL